MYCNILHHAYYILHCIILPANNAILLSREMEREKERNAKC